MTITYPFDTPAGLDTQPEGLRLLAQGPMARARMNGHDVWLALGYDAVRQILTDPRMSRESAVRPGSPVTNQAGSNPELLVSIDPPRHTRIRRLMGKAFTARMVTQLEPRVHHLVDRLLDGMASGGKPADLVGLVAEPLPVMVICELLGVPDDNRAQLREWASRLIAETAYPPAEIAEAIKQVDAYLSALIATKRDTPDDALITALINVNDEGNHLSPTELVSNVQLLLIAGHETTVSQIGNSVVTLFQHPDQATLLAEHPELLPRAVEEIMRYSQLTAAALPRVASADVPVGGVVIRAGEAVVPMISVANRDPAVFDDPHCFDITRIGPAPHVAFGHGPHFCLGAQLAQLELRSVLGALSHRFPTLAPAVDLADLPWKTGLSVRALHALPVTW
ncbi:MAG TPA: cytochrome P450 [Pseudonocardiaceae bacterium]